MRNKFEKNYTDQGYLMNYEKSKIKIMPNNRVMQFYVELSEILPLIWRRIQVPINYNFWDLHVAIQDAMGWKDYHLHYFEIKGKHQKSKVKIGIPDFDRISEENIFPGWEIPIFHYFNDLGVEAEYQYDYGDSWWHTIKLEGYMFKERKTKYPNCIGGERACPPEDCGGEIGYYEKMEILSNPKHKEYEDIKMWVGENWDSELFLKDSIKFYDPKKRWENAFLKNN